MVFPALELVERRQVRVPVVERHDQPEEHLVVGRVIQEASALGVTVQRPACRVQDFAGFVPRSVDFPDFLEADAVVLRVGIRAKVEALHQGLAEIAAHAFGKNRVLAE